MGTESKSIKYLILSDLYRYHGKIGILILFRELLFGTGFKYTFWLRLCRHFRYQTKFHYPIFLFCWMVLRHYMFKFGIQLSHGTEIGPGFYIGHFGTIVVSPSAVIGKNCNISQGVTVGRISQGERAGAPIIGDNVYIGPGAKLIGNIKIGDNVAIGANAVVTKDVDTSVVVAGVPAKVISDKGSFEYINLTDYDKLLRKNNRV